MPGVSSIAWAFPEMPRQLQPGVSSIAWAFPEMPRQLQK